MPGRLLSSFLLSLIGLSLSAQDSTFCMVYAGVNYGGPIPAESIENAEGVPGIGFSAGGEFVFPLGDAWSLHPGVLLAYTHLSYGQTLNEDTLYALEDAGGARVPTYYTAKVDGRMQSLHMNVSLPICYSYGHNRIGLGLYGGSKLWHLDRADVRVVIGEGGYFDDVEEEADNSKAANPFCGGLVFTYSYQFCQNWHLMLHAQRSLTPLHKAGNELPGPDTDMYETYVNLMLGMYF